MDKLRLEVLNNPFWLGMKVTVKIGSNVVTRTVHDDKDAGLYIWYRGMKIFEYEFAKGYKE